jgi:TrmH family RNA methyltransferase
VHRITSRQNPRLREVARLVASARDRRRAGKCVLEGEHLIGVHADRLGAPEVLVIAEDCLARPGIQSLASRFDARALLVPAALFADLATLPAGVGVLALIDVPQPGTRPPADFCLLLEDVQDPGNVGSMLRSAAAAGVTQVYLSRHCAFAWSPKVLRAGQGAQFHLDIHEDVDLPAWAAAYAESRGSVVAAIASGGSSLYAATLRGRVALAIGNEGSGLSPTLRAAATHRVTIPMPGGIESLNAAAAAAVCLFECVRQRTCR